MILAWACLFNEHVRTSKGPVTLTITHDQRTKMKNFGQCFVMCIRIR